MRVLLIESEWEIRQHILEPLLILPDLHIQLARTNGEVERLLQSRGKFRLGLVNASADLSSSPLDPGPGPIAHALHLEKGGGEAFLYSHEEGYRGEKGRKRLQAMMGDTFTFVEIEEITAAVQSHLEKYLTPALAKIVAGVRTRTEGVRGVVEDQLQGFVGSVSTLARGILRQLLEKDEGLRWGLT